MRIGWMPRLASPRHGGGRRGRRLRLRVGMRHGRRVRLRGRMGRRVVLEPLPRMGERVVGLASGVCGAVDFTGNPPGGSAPSLA